MEKNLQVWADKTNAIWVGVLLFAIGSFAYSVFSGIAAAANTADSILSISGGTATGGGKFFSFLEYLLLATVIVGYALFIIGLKGFREILGDDDSRAVGKLYIGAILTAVSYVCILVGLWAWIAAILNIIAFVFMLLGYMSLKNSSTFPAQARKGASNLFMSMVLFLIAGILLGVLGWIPLLGYVIGAIAGIINLVAFILILVGWAQIKNADPAVLL